MINDSMLPVGTMLHNGAYRIERQLGSGGFGNTYKVQKLPFEETYAMKEFFLKGVNLRTDGVVTVSVADNKSTFESQKRKFTKEAMRLRKIKNEHIVHVEDFFECDGTAYYVMEFIDGESLAEMVNRSHTPLPETQVRFFLDQLLDALQTIHSDNPPLTHLDIKPGNIMCDQQGNIKLIDFGASKQFSTDGNSPMTLSTMCYTPGYAPTEQTEQTGKMIGPWTDFYSLGATLYHLLTLNNPPSYTMLIDEGEHAFDYPVPISDKMRQLIMWMMKPQRKLRPQSVEEIRQFLSENVAHPATTEDETQLDEVKAPLPSAEETRLDKDINKLPGEEVDVAPKEEKTQLDVKTSQNEEKTVYDHETPAQLIQDKIPEPLRYNQTSGGPAGVGISYGDTGRQPEPPKLPPIKWPWYVVIVQVLLALACVAGFVAGRYYCTHGEGEFLVYQSILYAVALIFCFISFKKKTIGLWGLSLTAIPITFLLWLNINLNPDSLFFLTSDWQQCDDGIITSVVNGSFLIFLFLLLMIIQIFYKRNDASASSRGKRIVLKVLSFVTLLLLAVAVTHLIIVLK